MQLKRRVLWEFDRFIHINPTVPKLLQGTMCHTVYHKVCPFRGTQYIEK